jgi:hypothetical protein
LIHRASPAFWECYGALPVPVRNLADGAFALLKRDPRHPSLHFKKVGRFWSVRVGLHHRAIGVEAPDAVLWFWIGARPSGKSNATARCKQPGPPILKLRGGALR